MKKTLCIIAAAALLTAGLTGCSGSGEKETTAADRIRYRGDKGSRPGDEEDRHRSQPGPPRGDPESGGRRSG